MIAAALEAAEQIFSRPFRLVLAKTLALTLLFLVLCGFGLDRMLFAHIPLPSAPWLAILIHAMTGLGIFAAMYLLVTPVTFAIACFFFDELADHVEAEIAGSTCRGRALPVIPALWIGVRFSLLSLAVNACALVLLFVPGLNLIAFFGANAYLLGRGFFELAALRYRTLADVKELRRRHGLRITLAGCLCAIVATVPFVNLLTPLFATAFLVRIAQPIVRPRLPHLAV